MPITNQTGTYTTYLDQSKDLAKEFFEHDVAPRAERERNQYQKLTYGIPTWHNNIPIYVGNVKGQNSTSWSDPNILGSFSSKDNSIYISPYDRDVPTTIVHEMTHGDQFRMHENPIFKYGLTGGTRKNILLLSGNVNAPKTERDILNSAYNASPGNDANSMAEKHASNREWRFQAWLELKEQLGRVPTLSETDEYINSLTDEDLKRLHSNGYQKEYMNHEKYNTEEVKNAMIHVAHNSQQPQLYTAYARSGGSLNYFDYFK